MHQCTLSTNDNLPKDFLIEKQRRKQYEMVIRNETQMQKTKEKKMSTERIFQEHQRRIIDKQIMMEERENFRKAYEEQRNYEKRFENAKIQESQQNKINQVRGMMEFKINRQKQVINNVKY